MPYIASGGGSLAGDGPSTGGVLNITAVAWTAGFQWWRSGDITRTQNVSEYMLVLALCLVVKSVVKELHLAKLWASFNRLLLSVLFETESSVRCLRETETHCLLEHISDVINHSGVG